MKPKCTVGQSQAAICITIIAARNVAVSALVLFGLGSCKYAFERRIRIWIKMDGSI